MPIMNSNEIGNFIEQLNSLLRYTDKIYAAYIKNGKKFVFASVLFDTNSKILDILKSNVALLPEASQDDAFDLIFHIDVWRTIWSDEVERQNPRWNDEFSFPNEITFPKDSVSRLLNLSC